MVTEWQANSNIQILAICVDRGGVGAWVVFLADSARRLWKVLMGFDRL